MLTILLSISISHARALISQSALASKFQDIIIPVVNPGDLVSVTLREDIMVYNALDISFNVSVNLSEIGRAHV